MLGAAKSANFQKPIAYPFHFEDHPGYTHVNTLDENASAVEKERQFVTFVFKPKRHA